MGLQCELSEYLRFPGVNLDGGNRVLYQEGDRAIHCIGVETSEEQMMKV